MSGARKPGAVCVTGQGQSIEDGTLCRQSSHNPGPVGDKVPGLWTLAGDAWVWAANQAGWATAQLVLLGSKLAATNRFSLPATLESIPQSGRHWVSQFPTSTSLDDLSAPFRGHVKRFLASLEAANASVTIAATLRPPERAYLMHFAFAIANEAADPRTVPTMHGVRIQWVHTDSHGLPDLETSRSAAQEMVKGYEIVYKPALISRHTEGKAIDMVITWQNDLVIARANGTKITISNTPRNGSGNTQLHKVGESYGVIKLLSDPPHWSSDGH
jgi:hypothetical protein